MDSSITHISSLQGKFDDEIDLEALLNNLGTDRLESLLNKLLGNRYRLFDAKGIEIIGHQNGTDSLIHQSDIEVDFEPIFSLTTWQCEKAQIELAVDIIKTLTLSATRYLMTAKLHIESINEDFSRLEEKKRELEISEKKYRTLSETLSEKVESQVEAIKHTQHQLYQSEKMAATGHLASGIAHEINTPLCYMQTNLSTALDYAQVIDGIKACFKTRNIETLEQYWEDNDIGFLIEDLTQSLKDCQQGIDKTAMIIKNLKDFSNVDREETLAKNVEDIIASTCKVFSGSIGDNIRLTLSPKKTKPIHCKPGYIGQATLNILLNAKQAIGSNDGDIDILVDENDKYVYVNIADNGPGITQDIINKVCNPFFTTKEVGEGTGLGLTVAYDITRSHGGYLDVRSQPGNGASITLFFEK